MLLHECKLTVGVAKAANLKLQVRGVGKIYLVNLAAAEATFKRHSFLASWGKGAFKLLTDAAAADTTPRLEFAFKNQDDLVVFNNVVMTLGDVMSSERKKKPSAGVCYHSLEVDENDPSKFTLKPTHRVGFIVRDADGAELGQTNICCKVQI